MGGRAGHANFSRNTQKAIVELARILGGVSDN